jgi:transcriptional regulator with XRE-family HTH domain
LAESRGDRAKLVRKAIDETQELFAARLTDMARALGLPVTYDGQTVSKIENEYRDLQLEDIAVYEAVDPGGRGWFWLAFGRERPAITRGRAKPQAATPKVSQMPEQAFESMSAAERKRRRQRPA